MKTILFLTILMLARLTNQTTAQNLPIEAKLTFGNGDRRLEVSRGEPVVFHYRLVSTLQTTRDESIEVLPDSLKNDAEIMKRLDSVFRPVLLDTTHSSWFSGIQIRIEAPEQKRFTPQVLHFIAPFHDEVSDFRFDDPLFAYLGIDPDDTRRLRPGTITITIGSVIPRMMDTVWSDPVQLIIKPAIIKKQHDLNQDQIRTNANYWLRRGRCKEAATLAQALYHSDTTSVMNMLLLADAHECTGQYASALQLMQKALMTLMKSSYSQTQPPDILMWRMMQLQEKVMKFE